MNLHQEAFVPVSTTAYFFKNYPYE